MQKKIKIGILGATGMVGQRFITLLENHPWFEVAVVAASSSSSGKTYEEAVRGRWKMSRNIPKFAKKLKVKDAENDLKEIAQKIDFVFCSIEEDKEKVKEIENKYASAEIPVVSNNSANRWSHDIPMIMPEINSHHLQLIDIQRKNHGWKKGFIVVKPNCSIQSYVPIVTALKKFKPLKIHVISLQAISGAGKNFETWPEMIDNVIPLINGEEEKSENEPMKIWGKISNSKLIISDNPKISATCIRVPVSDGHLANVSITFKNKPTKKQILEEIENFNLNHALFNLNLPSSPKKLIQYFSDENKPQTAINRNYEKGMGITMGRLRNDKNFDYSFIALSHNTIRGAAGGAILTAELLVKKGYI